MRAIVGKFLLFVVVILPLNGCDKGGAKSEGQPIQGDALKQKSSEEQEDIEKTNLKTEACRKAVKVDELINDPELLAMAEKMLFDSQSSEAKLAKEKASKGALFCVD